MSECTQVPSIESLDIKAAKRTATCQDCDWETTGSATAPLAAAHADSEGHEVAINHFLNLASHPGSAASVSPLGVNHSGFDDVTITQVDVWGWCTTNGCGCNFASHEGTLSAALTHGQRYNHDAQARLRVVVDALTEEPAGSRNREIVTSLH